MLRSIPHSHAILAWLEIISLVVATILILWSARASLIAKRRSRPGTPKLYEDKDGAATEETQTAYSVFWENIVFGFIVIGGIIVSIIENVYLLRHGSGSRVAWLDFAVWMVLAVQYLVIVRERKPALGAQFALPQSLVFFTLFVARTIFLVDSTVKEPSQATPPIFYLESIKSGFTFVGFITCLLYPSRPEIFHQGYLVDQQFTVSPWNRYNYSWAGDILKQSRQIKKKTLDTFRRSDHMLRTADMMGTWRSLKETSSFLWNIHIAYFYGISWHWIYMFINSVAEMAPQLVMYQLLKVLQMRDDGQSITQLGLMWVIALGLSQLVAAWTNARMWFFGEGYIHIPLRLHIPALVFSKAMRKKDIKGASKKVSASEIDENANSKGKKADSKDKTDEEDDDVDETKQSKQAVINLIGVDADRIANFLGIEGWLFGGIIKMVIVIWFLSAIVGWLALFVGVALMALTIPLNIWFTKKYLNAQDDLMKARDKKLQAVNEALGGIRQIKFSALEQKWEKKIMKTRDLELDVLWTAFKADIWLTGVWLSAPLLINGGCLITFALMRGFIEPSVAFTSVSLLNKLGNTLAMFPEITTMSIDCWVSAKRIGKYLNASEKQVVATPGKSISFEDATISWPADEVDDTTFKLFNLNMNFPLGELSVISGRTGSGKSLLLSAILGEIELLSGQIVMPKSPTHAERHDNNANKGNWILPNAVAFVPQIPWIENCSFKDNILFGLPYDKERYDQVIKACALEKDLEILIDGDSTEIGPKGINLSGGQQWRLTLARALYSRAGILLLDDIFSAVDAHVARHIYETALTGPISEGRTRILVTHHVSLCRPKTKYEVHLDNGTVSYQGAVKDLERSQLLVSLEDEEAVAVEDDVETALEEVERQMSNTGTRKLSTHRRSRRESERPDIQTDEPSAAKPDSQTTKKFVEEEARESGHVSWKVYSHYLKACGGPWFWIITVSLFLIFQALQLARSWVIKLWSDSPETHAALSSTWGNSFGSHFVLSPSIATTGAAEDKGRMLYYSELYIFVSVFMCLEGTLRYYYVFTGSLRASRSMFKGLTFAVLRAPLRWLDTMPVGRILNRFTADFNKMDTTQAYGMSFGFWNFLSVVGIGIAGAIVSPYLLLVTFVLLLVSIYYAGFYLDGARDCKRLESTAKSPVFEHLSAALQGVTSLRAFEKMEVYTNSMFAKIDAHGRCLWHLNIYKRWLGWRLAIVGTGFSTTVGLFLVGYKNMDAALGGFALSFALSYTDNVFYLLRQYVEVELGMNSTERIIEYSEIEIETQAGEEVPASWPSEGKLEVENLVVSYAPNLPPVLKGLSFDVKANERVGVVGRTGAGKSSLTLALFRFLKANGGKIIIDGIDVSGIKLHDLRSRLAIIPQDPVLFSGTVRTNLDPFDERTDDELIEALRRVHLISSEDDPTQVNTPLLASSTQLSSFDNTRPSTPKPAGSNTPTKSNKNLFTNLSSPISESGSNLSQGQRQLLCLARAIVARPKIMFLDEATSAVDKITDTLIQRSIREEFEDATLLVIAHRLSTIADFDRILVLDDGKVVEYDTPKNLWELGPEKGVFRGMVESSGEREVLEEMILGVDSGKEKK